MIRFRGKRVRQSSMGRIDGAFWGARSQGPRRPITEPDDDDPDREGPDRDEESEEEDEPETEDAT